MKRAAGILLTLLLVLPVCGGAGQRAPASETHLFRAGVSDNGLVVFLPENEIASEEDAAAYLDWARKTYPAQASRLRAAWASEGVDLPAAWPAEAALLKEGDSAVDASGAIGFEVAEPLKNGKFKVRPAAPPSEGESTPHLCLTNVWVLPREELLERWRDDLRQRPDEARAEVKAQIEALRGSGRFGRDGGAAWRDAIEDFRTNTAALWPRVRFENRTGVPIEMWCQQATNTVPPGETWSVAVREPPASGDIKWFARAAADPALRAEDYSWATNSVSWSQSASSDPIHFFEVPPGTAKPMPLLRLMLNGAPFPMLKGLRATIDYKDGKTETVRAQAVGKFPNVAIRPHVALSGIVLEADGYEPTEKLRGKVEINLGCGDELAIPFPKPLVPIREEEEKAEKPQESGALGDCALASGKDKEPQDSGALGNHVQPLKKTLAHPIAPWPGEVRPSTIPLWPWPGKNRQQIRMRVWWNDFRTLETTRPGRDDYDRNNVLKGFDDLLQAEGDFKNAYLHIVCCKGCAFCKAHRDSMQKAEGFDAQRWALFQSLLLNSGVDWGNFDYPPDGSRIQGLRLLLDQWKEKSK